jgi:hypothetical protein
VHWRASLPLDFIILECCVLCNTGIQNEVESKMVTVVQGVQER